MLTGQEAEISILEEELEKMAVVAGECSGRASIAEERLRLVERELVDSNGKSAVEGSRDHAYFISLFSKLSTLLCHK
jgi:hypothetical protein